MYEDLTEKTRYGFDDLCTIMDILRGPGGCPWDIEQTHESIRKNFIEEVYEVCEAIDLKDSVLLCEELGDVLLQVVFHVKMEHEAGTFDMEDVCTGICRKLIERHPHIFGQIKVKNTDEVLANWETIKKKEKGQKTQSDAVDSVPKTLPALMRAQKVQQRAARSGFDYTDVMMALDDLKSEVKELEQAIQAEGQAQREEELGDLLFAAVNVARFTHQDAEESLTRATEKFAARFRLVEEMARERGIDMQTQSIQQLDLLWKEAKSRLTAD